MTVIHLANEDLQRMLAEEPELLLLDVRTPEEYFMLGHIPGARLLPIYELPGQLQALEPERKTVVICEHGVRSANASQYLEQQGFKQIYNLTAGMAEWNGARAYASEEAPTE
ncbi:MAG TPA: rhodanese-like domain-containing protein [Coleofasciculaceae cyanobacterium]|jgi:rhodanese-related sulfurtransferase